MPCFPTHNFAVPSVGDRVWIMFRQGHIDYPVYMGQFYSVLKDAEVKGRLETFGEVEDKVDVTKSLQRDETPKPRANNSKTYMMPAGNESPEESWQLKSKADPTVYVLFKSPKGHTLYLVDDDGQERFIWTDRFGQSVELNGPVQVSDNSGNASQRGTGLVKDSTVDDTGNMTDPAAVPMSKAQGRQAFVQITDGAKQYLNLTASDVGANKITFKGQGSGFITIEQVGQLITIKSDRGAFIKMDDSIVATAVHEGGSIKSNVTMLPNGDIYVTADKDIHVVAKGNTTVDVDGTTTINTTGVTTVNSETSILINAPKVTINGA